jgi:ATP-dependent Clp protease adaptor protein ClpS
MGATKTQEQVDVLEELVSEYNIVLYNDEVNTFDHVINCLVRICDHEPLQAEQCAWIVHLNGKCAVKSGIYDELEPLCLELLNKGLSVKVE